MFDMREAALSATTSCTGLRLHATRACRGRRVNTDDRITAETYDAVRHLGSERVGAAGMSGHAPRRVVAQRLPRVGPCPLNRAPLALPRSQQFVIRRRQSTS